MTKRILISIDDAFLEHVDERAKQEHRTRSELIREALRSYLRLGYNHAYAPQEATRSSEMLSN